MQIKHRRLCLGRRPLLRILPLAAVEQPPLLILVPITGAHQEVLHRSLRRHRRLDAFQIEIKPSQMEVRIEVRDRCIGSEVDVACILARVAMVRPRPNHHSLRRLLQLRKLVEVLNGPAKVDVIPSANVKHRHIRRLRIVLLPLHAQCFPVRPVVRLRRFIQVIAFIYRLNRKRAQPLA